MVFNMLKNVGNIHKVLANCATFDFYDAFKVLEVEHRTKILEEWSCDPSSF